MQSLCTTRAVGTRYRLLSVDSMREEQYANIYLTLTRWDLLMISVDSEYCEPH